MEEGVRRRDGVLRARFFTDDATFYPFADTAQHGRAALEPYLIAYNSGEVTINEIDVWSYDFIRAGAYLIEFGCFDVRWALPDLDGFTTGKGIHFWRRGEDGQLRMHRQIGLHDHR